MNKFFDDDDDDDEIKKGTDPKDQYPLNTLTRLMESKYNLFSDEMPIIHKVGIIGFELEPETITVIAAQPGEGKSSLACQMLFEALRLDENLKMMMVNCELTLKQVRIREISRLAKVDSKKIRRKTWTDEQKERCEECDDYIQSIADRFCFIDNDFDLINIEEYVKAFKPNVICLDYIQCIQVDRTAPARDMKSEIDAAMSGIRRLVSKHGIAAIVISSMNRNGNAGYDGNINMGRMAGSSSIEYASDDLYIMDRPDGDPSHRMLHHKKARNDEPKDIHLHFEGKFQRWNNRLNFVDEDIERTVGNEWK